MEVRITCALGLCLLLGCAKLRAFNLDTDNVLRKNGDPGSLFGFSLAMHRQLEPMDKRMLLVGAPRAKALRGQKSKVTGGLYSCDMTSTSSSCDRVIFDNTEDLSAENKENQWMGVSVSSQGPGGKIVTCAHRYQIRSAVNRPGESRDITGRCYMLNQDLTINEDSGAGEGGSWHFCKSRPRGHEMFGSCQQGVAAIFDSDFHYVIFGAPGAYNWKGIVRLEQRNDTFIEMGIYEDGPFELGDENEKKPSLVPAPVNSYLGFSLDTGMSLTQKGQLTIVAGAPRANHSGAVVLLKRGQEATRIVLEEYTLEGEGLASSFGYDVTVLDLNGDGWEDIVVGAPQYFEKDGEIGGAVYVYINKAGKWNKVKPTRIDGPQDSMFGLAVAKLGDINQDNYHDFAVGAPNHDNGIGSVYIYHGSRTGLKSKKAAQILPGEPLGMKMFGYSLAGNMDLDKNSYPDLAVGSLSDAIFVYKARPVISIEKKITFTPQEIDLTKKNCDDKFCLEVKACFTYTANPPSYSPKLAIRYSLDADAEHRKNRLPPRATFLDKSSGILNLEIKGKEMCQKSRLVIQDNIRDKLHGIPVDVSVEIEDAKRKRRQSVATPAPVLNADEPNSTRSLVHFRKDGCGDDNMCESNLQVKYRYGYRTIDDETFTPLSMEDGVPVISLSDQKEIALEVTVTNHNGDDAYEASVNATLPPSLVYSAYRSSDNTVSCIANKEGTKTKCDIGNPFQGKTETTFYIILGTAGISLNTTEVEIELLPYTTSIQKTVPVKAKAKVALILQLSVTGLAKPSQVYFSEEVKGERAMKSESDIGSAIAHQFRIINLGKRLTDFGTASLEIDWPRETEDQKWLLYLVKISATGLDNFECFPMDVINKLQVEPSMPRTKRALNIKDKATLSRLSDKKYETLSCGKGAKCVKIKCSLRGFDSTAVITLTSRLWNSTFIENYSKLHHVEVIVKASLGISSTLKNTKLQNAMTEVSLTVFPEQRSAQFGGGVPWWIILLSVLFGLLLLALLAFLLWKCGVFDKKHKEEPSEKERLTNA
ncbi:integrin alpha-6-like isoform X2 [Eucyclogobius newberryi]|uniref:integrin alpha-6-like isoform X2 n=1 Tax=Eucyclogobius newberryi TaxID=166745 RepID=UPI003B5B4C11